MRRLAIGIAFPWRTAWIVMAYIVLFGLILTPACRELWRGVWTVVAYIVLFGLILTPACRELWRAEPVETQESME